MEPHQKNRPAKAPSHPHLRLVRGGVVQEIRVGTLRVVAAPATSAPFAVEARVEEEDTYLVLSAPFVLPAQPEHPIRLMTEVLAARGETPGSVVVRGGRPLRLLAVVHDLGAEPTWKEEWIAAALAGVLGEAGRRGLGSLALPLLGTRHGRLAPERFMVLLRRALAAGVPAALKRLWLVLPPPPADACGATPGSDELLRLLDSP